MKFCFLTNFLTKLPPRQINFRCMPFLQTLFLLLVLCCKLALASCNLREQKDLGLQKNGEWGILNGAFWNSRLYMVQSSHHSFNTKATRFIRRSFFIFSFFSFSLFTRLLLHTRPSRWIRARNPRWFIWLRRISFKRTQRTESGFFDGYYIVFNTNDIITIEIRLMPMWGINVLTSSLVLWK